MTIRLFMQIRRTAKEFSTCPFSFINENRPNLKKARPTPPKASYCKLRPQVLRISQIRASAIRRFFKMTIAQVVGEKVGW